MVNTTGKEATFDSELATEVDRRREVDSVQWRQRDKGAIIVPVPNIAAARPEARQPIPATMLAFVFMASLVGVSELSRLARKLRQSRGRRTPEVGLLM